MGSINVQGVSKQYGTLVVLNGVSVEFHSGRIAGVVGPNGAGKTTLFELIAGRLEPDLGTVTSSKGMNIGYLTQEPVLTSESTVHDEVLSVFDDLLRLEQRMHALSEQIADRHDHPETAEWMAQYDQLTARFEAAGGYAHEQKVAEVLGGLGFSEYDKTLTVSALSGGQKCRVALAKLLLRDHTMLLLDEPTNHLDIDAVRWLEKFLAGHHGGAAIISHDRYLLDRVADCIVEVDLKRVTSYPGNYTNYLNTKERLTLSNDRQHEKDQAFIAKERDFIARHLAGQRTKEAQGRRTRLERRIRNGEFVLERSAKKRNVAFKFDASSIPTGEILRVEALSKSYDEKRLFHDLSFQVGAAERLGITGPNGTGKTTLLGILLGNVDADQGAATWNSRTSIGYYAQEAEELTGTRTVLEELIATCPDMGEAEARSYLACFRFTGDDVFRPVGVLSGGEHSRLRLIKLLKSSPNVLVLDEATNHLDIDSREALEAALAEYPGTIIAVSHDRYFLDRLVDRLLVLRPDGHRMVGGNYSDYIALIEAEPAACDLKPGGRAAKKRGPSSADKKKRTEASATARFDALSVEAIEEMIIDSEERIGELNARFATPDVYKNPDKLAELRRELDSVKAELALMEAAWSERVETM